MREILWTKQAQADLAAIRAFIGQDSAGRHISRDGLIEAAETYEIVESYLEDQGVRTRRVSPDNDDDRNDNTGDACTGGQSLGEGTGAKRLVSR